MKHLRGRVLVVDDEPAVRTALRVNLGRAGFEVVLCERADEALDRLRESGADIVLSDIRMPGMDGLELLETLRPSHPDLPVVLMTGFGSVDTAVRAMKAGAFDYIIKPIEKDELIVVLERALEKRSLVAEVEKLRAEVDERYGFENLVGATPAIREVFRLVRAVADSDARVLLTGPTGTGKELLARAIHYRSPRRKAPFVAINCAALPEGLVESELFGHEKGAFTGAVRRHRGRFEQADGGTLLLDEVGEVPLSTQVRLLRVLETAELQRVGGTDTIKVDVRVIAATNRDLRAEVRAGRFREDLYYRLNVFHIPVPPLRERLDDIPLLVDHFIARQARAHQRPARRVSPEVLDRLMRYPWPGNVRELEHVIERAVILSPGEVITEVRLPDLDEADAADAASAGLLREGWTINDALADLERRLIVEALRRERGVQARAARLLGISRSNLNYRIKKLGIQIADITYR